MLRQYIYGYSITIFIPVDQKSFLVQLFNNFQDILF